MVSESAEAILKLRLLRSSGDFEAVPSRRKSSRVIMCVAIPADNTALSGSIYRP